MSEATRPCPLCRAERSELVGEKRERNRTHALIRVVRCGACGFAYLAEAPRDFDDDLYAYYARRRDKSRDELYDPLTTRRYESLLEALGERTPGRRLLDVGCGQGQLADVADRLGWDALGIDLAEPAIEIACRLGAPCRYLDVFDPELEPNSFDVVTMFELVEHLSDPIPFLARVASLVRPGGLLYLTTPNFASLDRRVQGMSWDTVHGEHLGYFEPSSLLNAMRAAAPEVELLELHTRNAALQSLKHGLRRLRPSRAEPAAQARQAPAESVVGPELANIHAGEKRLRGLLEKNPLLGAAKSAVNTLLDLTGTGNAMTLLARKAA